MKIALECSSKPKGTSLVNTSRPLSMRGTLDAARSLVAVAGGPASAMTLDARSAEQPIASNRRAWWRMRHYPPTNTAGRIPLVG